MSEELNLKLSYQQRARRGMEMDAIEKYRPRSFPWWLILISLAIAAIVFFLAALLFKAKSGLIIEGIVSLIAFIIPGFFWRNSKKFLEQDKIFKAKVEEIDNKYWAMIEGEKSKKQPLS